MHSYSQMIVFPYSYNRSKSKDHEELVSAAELYLSLAFQTQRNTWFKNEKTPPEF